MRRLIWYIGPVCLAAVFLFAAVSKIGDSSGAVQALRAMGVESSLASWVMVCVVSLELSCGTAYLFRRLSAELCALTGALLASFVVFQLALWSRFGNIDCGCFGFVLSNESNAAMAAKIGFNVGLLVLVVVIEKCRRTACSDSSTGVPRSASVLASDLHSR